MNREFLLLVRLCAIARGLPVFQDPSLQNFASTTDTTRLPLDEERLLRQALQHKTVSTLYAGLSTTATQLSQPVMKRLKRLMAVERSSRSFLMQEWRSIDEACRRHGIAVMTVKGPAASLQLYNDAMMREYTDLDMVVSLHDLHDMVPVMDETGYSIKAPHQPADPNGQPESRNLNTSSQQPPMRRRLRHYSRFIQKSLPEPHLAFSKKTSPFRVEINNKVFKDGCAAHGTSLEQVFTRSESVVQEGYAFATLGRADHAVFMLQHGFKHSWSLLHWVLDAAAILHRNDPALHTEMAERIRSLQWERQLALIIRIVQKLFPIAVPDPFKTIIAPYLQTVTTPARIAFEQLQQAEDSNALSTAASILRFIFLYQLPLAQGLKEKVTVLSQLWLVTPADAETLPLPRFLQPLYLLLAPFFMVSRRFKRLLTRRKNTCIPKS